MLESHTREIDTIDKAAIKRDRENMEKKNTCEETKQKCRLGTTSNQITGGGGGGGG